VLVHLKIDQPRANAADPDQRDGDDQHVSKKGGLP